MNRRRADELPKRVEASSKREAHKLLAQFVAEVDGGRAGKAPAKLTVKQLCEQWLDVKAFKSEASREQHEWATKGHIIPKLGNMSVRTLEVGHIERFYRSLHVKLAARSIRHVHASLRQVLDYARRSRTISHNPAVDVVGLPSVDDRTVTAPEPDEVNEMLAAMCAHNPQWYALSTLVTGTGIRRAEVCGLRWRWLDLDRCFLVVVETVITVKGRMGPDGVWIRGSKRLQQKAKTDRSIRQVGFGESVAEVLRAHKRSREEALDVAGLEWDDDGFVFSPDLFGRDFFAPYSVTQMFRRIREHLDGNGVHAHKLRHFSATMAAQAGVPLTENMGRHGWINYRTALKYQHYTATRDEQAANAVADVLKLPQPTTNGSGRAPRRPRDPADDARSSEHTKDADCMIDPETLTCSVCGVDHSGGCDRCGGRGFHLPTCPSHGSRCWLPT